MKKEAIWTIGLVISLSMLLISPGLVCAGPNQSAGCALDLDYTTRDYDPGITSKDIESEIDAAVNDEIWIAVVAQNVTNLDTYQVEVNFDSLRMSFLEGYEDNAFAGVTNLLKTNGGTSIGFQAVETTAGTVNVSNALTGASTDEAPEGSGIIALLNFRVLDEDFDNGLTLCNIHYLDSEGVDDAITHLMDGRVNPSPGGCLDNSDCDTASYCAKAEGDCYGEGVCTQRPEVCTLEYIPVCGCDGETYINECEAARAGVSIDYQGPCEGLCYSNSDCTQGSYCAKPEGDCDGQGVCTPVPYECPYDLYDPVCGCDGQTYVNDCEAAMAGVSVAYEGACAGVPTVKTGLAISVTSSTAVLTGTINPNGLATTYYFEYGRNTDYGNSTAEADAGSGSSELSVSEGITGLSANTTYHFRLVAMNSAGVTYAENQEFKTSGGGGGTLCSILGDDPGPLASDMDVFKFSGTEGETVTVTLESSPPEYGEGQRAVLIMRNLEHGLRLFRRLNEALPLEMTVTLPVTGDYHVKVMEAPGKAVIWGQKYEGDYCVTLDASPETVETFVPDLDIE